MKWDGVHDIAEIGAHLRPDKAPSDVRRESTSANP